MNLNDVVENLIFAAAEPISFNQLVEILDDFPNFSKDKLENVLKDLQNKYLHHAIEFKILAGGFCMQTRQEFSPWVQKLFIEKPRKYSQAMLEVLTLIAYEGPITRVEIEQKRGVAVAPQMIKGLMEREWIKVVGYKDKPGKPALYSTTTQFLNYFNIASLAELPHYVSE